MSNAVARKNGEQVAEAKRQYAQLANALARVVTDLEDMKERRKELAEAMRKRNERELAELKELSASKKVKEQQLSETVGGIKLAMALLKKWDVDAPNTKLEKLAEKHDHVAALVESN